MRAKFNEVINISDSSLERKGGFGSTGVLMATKDIFLYSRNCFFDVCLLSYSKNEDFKQLSQRIRLFPENYSKQRKCASCLCCTHSKLKGIWLLREVNHEFEYICKYVVCKNYLSYILKDIFICEYEEKKMNNRCLERRTFTRCVDRFPCCYNYYRSGLLTSEYFCVNCKTFLASLSDFKLNKISLVEENDR